jgi:hypothetical protein
MYNKPTCHSIAVCIETSLVRVGIEVFTAVTMKNAVFWDVSEECVASIFGVEDNAG